MQHRCRSNGRNGAGLLCVPSAPPGKPAGALFARPVLTSTRGENVLGEFRNEDQAALRAGTCCSPFCGSARSNPVQRKRNARDGLGGRQCMTRRALLSKLWNLGNADGRYRQRRYPRRIANPARINVDVVDATDVGRSGRDAADRDISRPGLASHPRE
jgi:hypothetical protein